MQNQRRKKIKYLETAFYHIKKYGGEFQFDLQQGWNSKEIQTYTDEDVWYLKPSETEENEWIMECGLRDDPFEYTFNLKDVFFETVDFSQDGRLYFKGIEDTFPFRLEQD